MAYVCQHAWHAWHAAAVQLSLCPHTVHHDINIITPVVLFKKKKRRSVLLQQTTKTYKTTARKSGLFWNIPFAFCPLQYYVLCILYFNFVLFFAPSALLLYAPFAPCTFCLLPLAPCWLASLHLAQQLAWLAPCFNLQLASFPAQLAYNTTYQLPACLAFLPSSLPAFLFFLLFLLPPSLFMIIYYYYKYYR